eukprot:scaffold512_cov175-Pinguiococcus_pyrenoidosus.AAC.1
MESWKPARPIGSVDAKTPPNLRRQRIAQAPGGPRRADAGRGLDGRLGGCRAGAVTAGRA